MRLHYITSSSYYLETNYFEAKPQLSSKCVSRSMFFFIVLADRQNILADTQGAVFQITTYKLGHPGVPDESQTVRL